MTSLVNTKPERIEVDGLKFWHRPGTSDIKAIREVVQRNGYGRYGFKPKAGQHWIDLGANIGAFSVWATSLDPSITVHAYEPDPTMCDIIERNLKANRVSRRVELFQSAVVADQRKTVTLHCNTARGNMWRNSIERTWRGGEDIVVPTAHIKRVLTAVPDGSYVKMDIEGTEMPLLEWMYSANQRFSTRKVQGIVFEWSFDVDARIQRFRDVTAALHDVYSTVKNDSISHEAPELWPAEWFPAARLVWAWN